MQIVNEPVRAKKPNMGHMCFYQQIAGSRQTTFCWVQIKCFGNMLRLLLMLNNGSSISCATETSTATYDGVRGVML